MNSNKEDQEKAMVHTIQIMLEISAIAAVGYFLHLMGGI